MANIPRPHIPLPSTPGLGTTVTIPHPVQRVAPIATPQTTLPDVSTPSYRDISLEITDTQEGRIAPICYGRVRFSPKLVHFDIEGTSPNYLLEMIVLIGEGEIDGVEGIWVDDQQVYPTPPAWAMVEVRTGSLTQLAVSCITNSTIASMTHPGQAYVAMRLALATAPLKGGIPHVEVAIRGLKVWDWRSVDLLPPAWSENPVLHVYDALVSDDYGAGVLPGYSGECDLANYPSIGTFGTSANTCDGIITYEELSWRGQTDSNQQFLLSTYDRLQSFKAPGRWFKVEVKIRATTTGGLLISFPCFLRTSPDGANIPPDLVCTPVNPVADTDYVLWGLWYDTHGIERDQLVYLVTLSGGVTSSAGPALPTAGVNDNSYGVEAWDYPQGITSEAYDTAVYGQVDTITEYLKGTAFGFSVPADATIMGISLQVLRSATVNDDTGDYVVDERVRLVKGGVVQATDKADTVTHWPTSSGGRTYGGPLDMWGTTWTPAEVNAANFGAVLSAHIYGPSLFPGNDCFVDFFKITVYFQAAGGGQGAVTKWHHNSLTDGYADGKAQYKSGATWYDQLYDHWFRVYEAEQTFRCSIVISERQPIEQLAKQILQTCHGRLSWWDGKYRVTLDGSASGSLVLSDLQSPVPDIPIAGGSLTTQRADSEVPNTCTGSYLDTKTWQRLPVKVESSTIQQGLAQPRILDAGFVAVPSGGQLYRLLTTWLARAGRTWRAQCSVPQHGLRLAPGDTVILTSRCFSVAKTMLVDDIADAAGGTFQLSLVEYDAADFSAAPYVPQAAIPTTTVVV